MSSTMCRYKTVMLIDDNEIDNFITEKVIKVNAFAERIQVHMDGSTAIEFLAEILRLGKPMEAMLPDVIFVDLNMPQMNGFQFIRRLYDMPDQFCRKSKVVILTSSLSEKDKETAKNLDPEILFLNKPLVQEHLSLIY